MARGVSRRNMEKQGFSLGCATNTVLGVGNGLEPGLANIFATLLAEAKLTIVDSLKRTVNEAYLLQALTFQCRNQIIVLHLLYLFTKICTHRLLFMIDMFVGSRDARLQLLLEPQ